MGSWGYRNFENDDALDFLAEAETDDRAVVMALEKVLHARSSDYVDATDSARALAGVELLAAKQGRGSVDFPKSGRVVIQMLPDPTPALIQKALAVISRIDTNSELRELMDDGGSGESFSRVLDDLRQRVSGSN